jgi:hypothetical protein
MPDEALAGDVSARWPRPSWRTTPTPLSLAALQHPLPMEVPVSSRRLVATGLGFSLHAGTAVHGNDRWDEEVVLSGRHTAGWTQSTLQGENDHE